MRRAASIGQALEQNRLDLNGLSDTLDHMGCAIFLLNGTAQIAFANADALRLLDGQTILRSVNGTLMLKDRAASAELDAVLGGAGDLGAVQRGIAIPMRSTDGTAYVGHLLPLTTGARRSARTSHRATATLFVRRLDASIVSDAAPLAQLYGLTPRELSVLAVLLQASGVKKVSASMGLSVETVRSHLKSIFQKTGAKRQVDLVKLVANSRTPFV